MVTMLPLNT